MISFFRGLVTPLIAMRFMWRHRALLKYSFIPIVINIVVFTTGGIISWIYFTDWLHALLPSQGDTWYWQVLFYMSVIFFTIILAVILVLTFTILGSIIASPFNDVLSEKTERIINAEWQDAPFSWTMLVGDAARSFSQELKKIIFFAVLFAGLFIINILPGAGSAVYLILNTFCTLWVLALEFIDFPMTRRRFSFFQKLKYIFKHIIPMIGFGAALFVLFFIPLINYLLLPIAVVGGTILFLELHSDKKSNPFL